MRAIYPKFLSKRAELFGLEMRDIFLCMAMICFLKLINLNDLMVIGFPLIYLTSKFCIKLFFPRFHFFFLAKRKKYLEWSRTNKRQN